MPPSAALDRPYDREASGQAVDPLRVRTAKLLRQEVVQLEVGVGADLSRSDVLASEIQPRQCRVGQSPQAPQRRGVEACCVVVKPIYSVLASPAQLWEGGPELLKRGGL